MRKSIVSVMLAAGMVFGLTACGQKAPEAKADAVTEAGKAETAGKETSGAVESKTEAESKAESKSEAAGGSSEAGGEGNTFTVGFDQDFPPMGFRGDDGEFTGFDLDLAKEVATRLGLTYVPQPIAWDAKDMELNSGTIDCIWNGFTMNGREDAYTWSDAYMNNSQVFVVAKDSGIADMAGLAGKIVEVQADSSAEAALKDAPELAGTFASLQPVPDYNAAFRDLEMGAADAVAMDVIVAGYQIEQRGNDDFVILDDELSSEKYAIGFKKGNEELRDKVQAALEEMSADGTLTSISEKWFGRDVTTIGSK